MSDIPLSVAVVINAPVERVWLLLIEQQQPDGQNGPAQKYLHIEPEGPPIAGQVIQMKVWFLQMTIVIDRVVPEEPPLTGQTIHARISFFGKEGEGVSRQMYDSDQYRIHTQAEFKHPWCQGTQQIDIRCLALDTTSCVLVYTEQSEWASRRGLNWLIRQLEKSEDTRRVERKAIEASLHGIKVKAEQHFHQTL